MSFQVTEAMVPYCCTIASVTWKLMGMLLKGLNEVVRLSGDPLRGLGLRGVHAG